jgi:hypothetical protein
VNGPSMTSNVKNLRCICAITYHMPKANASVIYPRFAAHESMASALLILRYFGAVPVYLRKKLCFSVGVL